MGDRYSEVAAAHAVLPTVNREHLHDVLATMIEDGPPDSVAFLQRFADNLSDGVVWSNWELEDTLDSIPVGEFMALCLVFADMLEMSAVVYGGFLEALGRLFGESIGRRIAV